MCFTIYVYQFKPWQVPIFSELATPFFAVYNCIIIFGPTASGKTKLAAALAHALSSEVISMDSRQVYRGMDIGTGKDRDDYIINGKTVPVHLLDVADAGTTYHLHQFTKDFYQAFEHITRQGKIPVLCGGTALYIHTVLQQHRYTAVPVNDELRKKLENKSREELLQLFIQQPATAFTSLADTSTAKRLVRAIEINTWLQHHSLPESSKTSLQPIAFGMHLSAEQRKANIAHRLAHRLQHGLIEETQNLLQSGIPAQQLIRYGLEYKYVTEYLQAKLSMEQLQQQLTIAIQQYSRRQMTWWRKLEREGLHLHLVDALLPVSEQLQLVQHHLSLQS
jgi:tRNA dimethylallyltransferase